MTKQQVGYLMSDFAVSMSLAHALELLQTYGLQAFHHYFSSKFCLYTEKYNFDLLSVNWIQDNTNFNTHKKWDKWKYIGVKFNACVSMLSWFYSKSLMFGVKFCATLVAHLTYHNVVSILLDENWVEHVIVLVFFKHML